MSEEYFRLWEELVQMSQVKKTPAVFKKNYMETTVTKKKLAMEMVVETKLKEVTESQCIGFCWSLKELCFTLNH